MPVGLLLVGVAGSKQRGSADVAATADLAEKELA